MVFSRTPLRLRAERIRPALLSRCSTMALAGTVMSAELAIAFVVRALPGKVDGQVREIEEERAALVLFDEGDAVAG